MLLKLKWVNVALRAVMETGIVIGFGYWGYHTGQSTGMKILLTIGLPLLGFGFWGLVDFRQAGSMAETIRLFQELIISGLAAAAFYASGLHTAGWTLAAITIIHHCLVYLLGERLIKNK
jgi:hypothetical protein